MYGIQNDMCFLQKTMQTVIIPLFYGKYRHVLRKSLSNHQYNQKATDNIKINLTEQINRNNKAYLQYYATS
jgi:hypothetical protein